LLTDSVSFLECGKTQRKREQYRRKEGSFKGGWETPLSKMESDAWSKRGELVGQRKSRMREEGHIQRRKFRVTGPSLNRNQIIENTESQWLSRERDKEEEAQATKKA